MKPSRRESITASEVTIQRKTMYFSHLRRKQLPVDQQWNQNKTKQDKVISLVNFVKVLV